MGIYFNFCRICHRRTSKSNCVDAYKVIGNKVGLSILLINAFI